MVLDGPASAGSSYTKQAKERAGKPRGRVSQGKSCKDAAVSNLPVLGVGHKVALVNAQHGRGRRHGRAGGRMLKRHVCSIWVRLATKQQRKHTSQHSALRRLTKKKLGGNENGGKKTSSEKMCKRSINTLRSLFFGNMPLTALRRTWQR